MPVINKDLLPVFASIVLVSVAQLFMRYGLMRLSADMQLSADLQLPTGLGRGISYLLENFTAWLPVLVPVGVGIGCYGVSVLCWMKALQNVRLSVAYPLLSISYLIVHVAAAVIPAFHESLQPQRLVGIAIVMLGIGLCVMPDRGEANSSH